MSSSSLTANQTGRNGSAPPTMSNLGVDRTIPRPREDSQLMAKLGTFVDHTANTARLDVKHRGFLHDFKELVLDMPPTHWRAMIHMQATALRTSQVLDTLTGEVEQVKTDIDEVALQSSKNFTLNWERMAVIRNLCKKLVFEPTRTDFENLAEHARDKLKDPMQYPDFEPAFKSEQGKATVMGYCRSQANYVRNLYRKTLKLKLFDPKGRCGLTACVRSLISKLDPTLEPSARLVLRVAIFRRFCMENPGALDCEDPPVGQQQSTTSGKRKRDNSGPFWEQVEDFLKEKVRELGEDITSEDWKTYINEALQEERRRFPDDHLPLLPQIDLSPPTVSGINTTLNHLGSTDDVFTTALTNTHPQAHGMEGGELRHGRAHTLPESIPSSPFSPSISRLSPSPNLFGTPGTPALSSSHLSNPSFVPSASSFRQSAAGSSSVHLPPLSDLRGGLQLRNMGSSDTSAAHAAGVRSASDWLANLDDGSSSDKENRPPSQLAISDGRAFNFNASGVSSFSHGGHAAW
ncbi:hypothetical protein OH76DRAFT_1482146 [Lentinus brumalis]|uniref:Uncharacterized protein n=1 Tax=Lentinus brumalis TaxID=2498619 RepID=A0A371DE08_9APHY|nr:hypothetical protein OH76DRAFT_1482146 [Polyporus brumalis]